MRSPNELGSNDFTSGLTTPPAWTLRQDGLEIAVPNDFISEWIGRNFTRPIQEATTEVLGCAIAAAIQRRARAVRDWRRCNGNGPTTPRVTTECRQSSDTTRSVPPANDSGAFRTAMARLFGANEPRNSNSRRARHAVRRRWRAVPVSLPSRRLATQRRHLHRRLGQSARVQHRALRRGISRGSIQSIVHSRQAAGSAKRICCRDSARSSLPTTRPSDGCI